MPGLITDSFEKVKHISEMRRFEDGDESFCSPSTSLARPMIFTLRKSPAMRRNGVFETSITSYSTIASLLITICKFDEPWLDVIK